MARHTKVELDTLKSEFLAERRMSEVALSRSTARDSRSQSHVEQLGKDLRMTREGLIKTTEQLIDSQTHCRTSEHAAGDAERASV